MAGVNVSLRRSCETFLLKSFSLSFVVVDDVMLPKKECVKNKKTTWLELQI